MLSILLPWMYTVDKGSCSEVPFSSACCTQHLFDVPLRCLAVQQTAEMWGLLALPRHRGVAPTAPRRQGRKLPVCSSHQVRAQLVSGKRGPQHVLLLKHQQCVGLGTQNWGTPLHYTVFRGVNCKVCFSNAAAAALMPNSSCWWTGADPC